MKKVKPPFNPFEKAFLLDDFDALRKMVEDGLSANERSSENGRTMLMSAAATNNIEMIRFLLSKGADVNLADKVGWTALHFAARDQHFEALEILLAQNVDIDAVDENGNSAIGYAAATLGEHRLPCVRLLLKHGANKDLKNKYGITAFDVYRDAFE